MIDSNIMIDSNNIIYRKLSVTIHIVVLFNRLTFYRAFTKSTVNTNPVLTIAFRNKIIR